VSTRVNTTAPAGVSVREREGGRKALRLLASPSPKGLQTRPVLCALLYFKVFASLLEEKQAGRREWPSDAKAASSNTKVAAGDLESRR
jgi:hypothetical protein